jgi:hypothetical protein
MVEEEAVVDEAEVLVTVEVEGVPSVVEGRGGRGRGGGK